MKRINNTIGLILQDLLSLVGGRLDIGSRVLLLLLLLLLSTIVWVLAVRVLVGN